jgi:putative transcriptional regulator
VEDYTGKLLIAAPSMADPSFKETVILLCKHEEEGSLGVILNRTSNSTLESMWKSIWNLHIDSSLHSDGYVQLGGPVFGPVISIHNSSEYSEKEIISGIHFCVETENVIGSISEDSKCKIYKGYTGWNKGQLSKEIMSGKWFVTDVDKDIVFGTQHEDLELYKKALHKFGDNIYREIGLEVPAGFDSESN